MTSQRGMTIIELLAVLTIGVTASLGLWGTLGQQQDVQVRDGSIRTLIALQRVAELEHARTGEWPHDITTLMASPQVPPTLATALRAHMPRFSLTADGAGVKIGMSMTTEHDAQEVAALLGRGLGSVSQDPFEHTVSIVAIPAAVRTRAAADQNAVDIDDWLLRNGSQPLTGHLKMGGYDIGGVGAISAQAINGGSLAVTQATVTNLNVSNLATNRLAYLSDRRMKPDAINLSAQDAARWLSGVVPVMHNQGQLPGFIADDVQTWLPGLVSVTSDGFRTLDYVRLLPVLWAVVQQHAALIKDAGSCR